MAKKPVLSLKSLSAISFDAVFLLYNLYIFVRKPEAINYEEQWLRAASLEVYVLMTSSYQTMLVQHPKEYWDGSRCLAAMLSMLQFPSQVPSS